MQIAWLWPSGWLSLVDGEPTTGTQLIYKSGPFGFDNAMLAGILWQARRNNARDGITGALIYRDDIYLQLLEGEHDAVQAAYARITPDDRHLSPQLFWAAEQPARLFPEWAMRDDRHERPLPKLPAASSRVSPPRPADALCVAPRLRLHWGLPWGGSHGGLRLHHRRRWQCRVRARQPIVRRSSDARLAAGGRR